MDEKSLLGLFDKNSYPLCTVKPDKIAIGRAANWKPLKKSPLKPKKLKMITIRT